MKHHLQFHVARIGVRCVLSHRLRSGSLADTRCEYKTRNHQQSNRLTRRCRISSSQQALHICLTHAQDFLVHLFQIGVHFWSVDRHGPEWLVRSSRKDNGGIGESKRFGDEVDLRYQLGTAAERDFCSQHPFGNRLLPVRSTISSCHKLPRVLDDSPSLGLLPQVGFAVNTHLAAP